MITKLSLLSCTILSTLLLGCSSSDSPFIEGGGAGSGTNVVSQKNFVLAFNDLNPDVVNEDGSFNVDVEVIVTFQASDRLNLATVGATAYLDVTWGTLSSATCTIDNEGKCSITWTSNSSLDDAFKPVVTGSPPTSALVSFTGWILGEESFSDLDGDTLFGDNDIFLSDSAGPFLDLNFDDIYSSTIDKLLVPGNPGGTLRTPDSLFNGAGCVHTTLCSPTTQVYISSRQIINIVQTTAP